MKGQAILRSRKMVDRSLIRLIFIFFGIPSIILGLGLLPGEYLVTRTWISCLGALAVLWSWFWLSNGGSLPLRTDLLVLAGFSLSYILPPLYLSIRIVYGIQVDDHNVYDAYPLVALITTIGALCILKGYSISRTMASPNVSFSEVSPQIRLQRKGTLVLVLLLSVAWIARFLILYKGVYYWIHVDYDFMFSQFYSVTKTMSSFSLVVIAFLWIIERKNHKWRVIAWLATAAEFLWIIPSGARFELIKLLFLLAIIAWWRRGRMPVKLMSIMVGIVFLVMPVMGVYRYTIADITDVNKIDLRDSFIAYQIAHERFERQSGNTVLSFADNFINRLYDGQFLGFLLKHYANNYEWEYGKTYLERIPFVFLPYFIYPDRPIMQVPIDQWFKLLLGGSCPTTFLGEAYLNFWYIGIPIVAFLMGLILGFYDKLFFTLRSNPLILAIFFSYASTMPFMVTQSAASWLGILRNAILLLLIVYLYEKMAAKSTVYRRLGIKEFR